MGAVLGQARAQAGSAAVVLLPLLLRPALGRRAKLRLDRVPTIPRRRHDRMRTTGKRSVRFKTSVQWLIKGQA